MYSIFIHSRIASQMIIYCMLNCFILFLLGAYRMYNYSVFAATSVGEGPPADGGFLTREESELINTLRV